jgi:hypothetical protein
MALATLANIAAATAAGYKEVVTDRGRHTPRRLDAFLSFWRSSSSVNLLSRRRSSSELLEKD